MGEFELIDRFVSAFGAPRAPLGPGDDAAVVGEACITTDTVVEGVHFTRRHFSLEDIGHKALAVNLSDLAAMGAEPSWFVCALSLNRPGDVAGLARGMARLARASRIPLVGGNVTSARELSITITAAGRARRPLLRSGARPGDLLYVSGTLGDARLGLACLGMRRAPRAQLRQRRPAPRIALGRLAGRFATAGIDLSDGLAGDLRHLCEASEVGAEVELARLPLSTELRRVAGDQAWRWAVGGGEDYELLVAVPARRARAFERATRMTCIGQCTRAGQIVFRNASGAPVRAPASFDHFFRTPPKRI